MQNYPAIHHHHHHSHVAVKESDHFLTRSGFSRPKVSLKVVLGFLIQVACIPLGGFLTKSYKNAHVYLSILM